MRLVRRQRKKLEVPDGPKRVKVGYPSGTDGNIIDRAVFNMMGTEHIPARPALQNAMRDNKRKYRAEMKASASKILTGDKSLRATLTSLGQAAAGDVQDEITALRSPPNAASTIRQKGSTNPLIDTAEMRNATTYKVDR